MANVNKVVYGGKTLIDLTSDTVTAASMLSGVKAHDKSGVIITGSAALATATVEDDTLVLTGGFPVSVS